MTINPDANLPAASGARRTRSRRTRRRRRRRFTRPVHPTDELHHPCEFGAGPCGAAVLYGVVAAREPRAWWPVIQTET